MPVYIAMLAAQIICGVHVVRRGHDRYWLWLIIFVPLAGCAIYIVSVVIPEFIGGSGSRVIRSKVKDVVDPQHRLRASADNVAVADTVENRVALARELVAHEKAHDAVPIYRSLLNGLYEDDPVIMLELAHALFACRQFSQTRQVLDELIAANPQFKSPEGHLLYARALDEGGEHAKALEEYRVLSEYYAGYEPKVRHGQLLKRMGRDAEARELLENLLAVARHSPGYAQKKQKQWIDLANRELSGVAKRNVRDTII